MGSDFDNLMQADLKAIMSDEFNHTIIIRHGETTETFLGEYANVSRTLTIDTTEGIGSVVEVTICLSEFMAAFGVMPEKKWYVLIDELEEEYRILKALPDVSMDLLTLMLQK